MAMVFKLYKLTETQLESKPQNMNNEIMHPYEEKQIKLAL